jgi:hypothetical protein
MALIYAIFLDTPLNLLTPIFPTKKKKKKPKKIPKVNRQTQQ